MGIDIESVLVCDAVDSSCVELLKFNGIRVSYKLKLSKDQLIEESKVKWVQIILTYFDLFFFSEL